LGKAPRYYQLIAINRTIEAIARGENRILLVMAHGVPANDTQRVERGSAMGKTIFHDWHFVPPGDRSLAKR